MSKIDKLIKLIEKTPYVNDEQQREIDYLNEEYGDTFIKTKLTKMGYTDDEISSILFEYSPEEILELTKVELDKAAKRTNEDVAGPGVNAMGTAPTPTASYKGKKFRLKKKCDKEMKKIEKLINLIEDSYDVMKGQAGNRILATIFYNNSKMTTHYASVEDFINRVKEEQEYKEVTGFSFNGEPKKSLSELDKLLNIVEDFEDEHGIGDDNDLYQEQFEMGQEVEKEHTKTLERLYDLAVSKDVPSKEEFIRLGVDSIAMDHLHEFDAYYTALKKMEKSLSTNG